MSRGDSSTGRQRKSSTPFSRRMLRFLVFLILAQIFPHPELSQIQQWENGKLGRMLEHASDILGPGEAQAITSGCGDPVFAAVLDPIQALGSSSTESCEIFLNLSARAKPTKVQLVWTNQPGAIDYQILRATEADPYDLEQIGDTTSTYSTYIDYTASNNTTYLYQINVVFPDGVYHSEVVSAHTPLTDRTRLIYNPVIYSWPDTYAQAGYPYSYTVQATDPNGYALTYNLAAAPDGMTIDPTGGTIYWTPAAAGGSFPVTAVVSNGHGGTATQQFTISVQEEAPTAIIAGNYYQVAQVGATAQLDGSGSTDSTGEPLSYQWYFSSKPTGSNAYFSDPSSATPTFVPDLSGDYTIDLVVFDGVLYSSSAEVQIHAPYPPPQITISASPLNIIAGGSSTISWTSTNATACVLVGNPNSLNDNFGDPANTPLPLSGTLTVSPTETTLYEIAVVNPDSTTATTASVVVTVIYPPTVSLSASPQTIQAGQSATLAWSSSNADAITIDNGIGIVGANGSMTVSPAQTTTYTITASGTAGTVTSSATVTVIIPAPTVSISATPQTILAGQSAALTWNSANAGTVTIDQGIGSVSPSGSLSVSPTQTTTYNITATGPGGTPLERNCHGDLSRAHCVHIREPPSYPGRTVRHSDLEFGQRKYSRYRPGRRQRIGIGFDGGNSFGKHHLYRNCNRPRRNGHGKRHGLRNMAPANRNAFGKPGNNRARTIDNADLDLDLCEEHGYRSRHRQRRPVRIDNRHAVSEHHLYDLRQQPGRDRHGNRHGQRHHDLASAHLAP